MKIRMVLKRETKNQWRFEEVDETGQLALNPLVRIMYLPKAILGRIPPKEIQVEVTWEGEVNVT